MDELGDLARCRERSGRVIGMALGGTEDGEQSVAHKFVRVSSVALDHGNDRPVELVQAFDDLLRGRALSERRKSAHVEEQHGDVDLLALEVRPFGEHALD
jgi:hypothetical protein